MRILVITGDKNFKPGNERYDLQRSMVASLTVVYWGKGNLFPKVPVGPYEVVTAQDPFWRGHFAWHLSKRLSARLNLQVHADLEAQPLWKRAWAGFNLRKAHSVRVVSQKLKEQVRAMGVSAPITVLPVYVDVTRFKSLSRSSDGTILWVGRFEPEKDPLLALEVLKKIPGSKLVMLGGGSLESRLKEASKNLPVTFPGWQDPLPYLARAAVVLCTSKQESWGASMIEALAAGVPVVAPDVGIAREAGALITKRSELAIGVREVLAHNTVGVLKLGLLSKEEWARRWKESL